jgi:hypothetical protein
MRPPLAAHSVDSNLDPWRARYVPFVLRAQSVLALAVLALTVPVAARAAPAVHGGSTRAGNAIVVNCNRSATKVRSIVIA